MRVLFDTSVLVAALFVSHPHHTACFSQLQAAKSKLVQGFISTHTLAETYSVITRFPIQPRIAPSQAQSLITDISQYLEIVPLLTNDYLAAIASLVALNLPGGGIFDALIAQAALKVEAEVLLTLNPNQFTRLGKAIAPLVQVPK